MHALASTLVHTAAECAVYLLSGAALVLALAVWDVRSRQFSVSKTRWRAIARNLITAALPAVVLYHTLTTEPSWSAAALFTGLAWLVYRTVPRQSAPAPRRRQPARARAVV
jgi:hypothetical protein